MTATIKPYPAHGRGRPRPLRFSSMESLGLSDASSTWSDSPIALEPAPHVVGRHVAPPGEPDVMADWHPSEFGDRLTGGNLRRGRLVFLGLLLVAAAGLGYWLYQRPDVRAQSSTLALETTAEQLDTALVGLSELNGEFATSPDAVDTSVLYAADAAARDLFAASTDLSDDQERTRSSAAAAAAATLDAVQLAGDTNSYRLAVAPLLATPDLETDPAVIELDEATRAFGVWQLRFDEVRDALPEGVLPEVTRQLDALSADLSMILSDYIDSLGADDATAASAAVAGLGARLNRISEAMTTAIAGIDDEITALVSAARVALDELATS